MVKLNEIKGLIASNGLTQQKLAKMLNISNKTMTNRIKKGNYRISEVEEMIKILKIDNPISIFFSTVDKNK